jgi:DNA replication and repair protein RecF
MRIEKLGLFQFRNYEEVQLEFPEKINCLVGANGSGKTNLLDAIYYLSLTKSHSNSVDSQNILHGENQFLIKGVFKKKEKDHEVVCSVQANRKKLLKVNQVEYEKLSDHIGKFPVVMLAPYDTDLIRDGSEVRRKLFDGMIAQSDSLYLQHLLEYQHVLKQRNSALKQMAESGRTDLALIEIYNEQMLPLGAAIHEARKAYLVRFETTFQQYFHQLVQKEEEVTLRYVSELENDEFTEIFRANLRTDIVLQRTQMGIHRDDYEFNLGTVPLKKFGSQGQQKSFVIALKMTQYALLKKDLKIMPLLLLDDIFDKLDDARIEQLIQLVSSEEVGQLFLTEARPERVRKLFEKLQIPAAYFHVRHGNCTLAKMPLGEPMP